MLPKVLMKCFLSGMPDLKLGLNDKIGLEKESQLKSLAQQREKTVSFVPPDGEFELMKYRITEGVNLPFRVLPTIKELGQTRMEVNVKDKKFPGQTESTLSAEVELISTIAEKKS
ncbi:hypothetical protein HAX54_034748 [Datura stramonium]|uniref:MHD domain-containing protein n=1 Tax=Datura stramonium TaxID=4076 RepID=A0ABS8RMG0_DATST|nr:hypothetical protein [Datura stramonium]